MSYNTDSNNDSRQTIRKPTRRPGRTLLLKSTNTLDGENLDKLEGLQSKQFVEKSNSYFLTFSTADQSLLALKELKKQYGTTVRLKFAHYRIYFTMQGLVNETDYNTVKTIHTALVTKSVDCNVLYYRLYRKNNSYLGCGEMTVDTKEGFDSLMKTESLKNFTLGDFTGVHYRYNKTKTTQDQPTQNAVAFN